MFVADMRTTEIHGINLPGAIIVTSTNVYGLKRRNGSNRPPYLNLPGTILPRAADKHVLQSIKIQIFMASTHTRNYRFSGHYDFESCIC